MKATTILVALVLAASLAPAAGPKAASPFSASGSPAVNEALLAPVGFEPTDDADETLKYDRTPVNGIGLTNGGTYRGAVRFIPAFACTLKAILFYQRDASSNDSVFVYGEYLDTVPGATLAGAPYTGAGQLQWKRVNLATPLVLPAGTDLWACCRMTHTAGTFPLGCDSGPMIRNKSGFISTGGAWQQIADLGLNYSWNIRAIVARIPGLAHDVGVSKIYAPAQAINPGAVAPKCRLVNYGASAESNIPVTCWIDSAGTHVYNQTATYAGPLAAGDRADVTFTPNWTPGPRGASYSVTFFSGLSGDLNAANDTIKQTTTVMTAMPWVDIDTGYCKLSVIATGAIGFESPSAYAGNGFRYPKSATTSALFFSSFAIGNAVDYVADRHFGNPPSGPGNTDLVAVESLRPIIPPTGDEQYRSVFTDQGHPTPKGLRITQNAHQSANPGYDDFVVLAYDIKNEGSGAVNGLYAGVFADFDIGSAPTNNTCTADTTRLFEYMRQSTTAYPTVGVKILAPQSFKNLTAIDHAIWVYPDSCMTDNQKFRLMNGTIVLRNSNRAYDWSMITSAGPFDLAVGASYRFAVAFIGGTDENAAKANADSAQSWYNANTGIVENPNQPAEARFRVGPNPFAGGTAIRYASSLAGDFELEVFDAAGRQVDQRTALAKAGQNTYLWQPKDLARGVYFLSVKTPDQSHSAKVLKLQ